MFIFVSASYSKIKKLAEASFLCMKVKQVG